jgi:Fe-S-cluster containining protein
VVKSYRESTGLFTLAQKSNGDCLYLDKNRLCVVYEKRPDVCRKFPLEMSRKIGHCPSEKIIP